MMKWMRERLGKDEGFTLIELMVVVLIIAILIAIAIPSFLGFRRNAQDRSAQSDVRNVLLAQQAYYTEHEGYAATQAQLQTIEPSILLSTTTPDVATVVTQNGTDTVCMTRQSESGAFYSVWVGESGGVHYGKADLTAAGACTADPTVATAHTPDGWS